MGQAIALWLILIYAVMADGITEAFGIDRFLAVGAAVLATAEALAWWGRWADEAYSD